MIRWPFYSVILNALRRTVYQKNLIVKKPKVQKHELTLKQSIKENGIVANTKSQDKIVNNQPQTPSPSYVSPAAEIKQTNQIKID